MNPELKGMPLSFEGKARLIGKPPFHAASAIIAINYRADPAEVRKLLPEPYEPSAIEPGGCSCWFGDWLILSDDDKDMIVRNPERVQYKECILWVRCRVNGVEGTKCPYIWVDNDFALFGGWICGWPKKLGRIHLGHSKAKLYELIDALGKVGPGTRFSSFLEAHGERLITGTVKLSRQLSPDELPSKAPEFLWPELLTLYFPSMNVGSKPLVHQLVQLVHGHKKLGEVWVAEDASLIFTESELEEHTAIKPIEITGAYYFEFGGTLTGVKVLHQW
jgi:hypothetical protein